MQQWKEREGDRATEEENRKECFKEETPQGSVVAAATRGGVA